MRIDIITIFPKMFPPVLNESIIKRAQDKKKVKIYLHDLRDYTIDKHRKVDDRPFGGGPGMVLGPQAIFSAVEKISLKFRCSKAKRRVILLSPQGKRFDQPQARRFSKYKHLIFICGHYEGVDERVAINLADEETCIGDYILTGGELPAMVIVDSLVRLLPGVLGDKNSLKFESFEGTLLEYPQYTRPASFKGMAVPSVLLSGNHKEIQKWRHGQSVLRTKKKRPDLFKKK